MAKHKRHNFGFAFISSLSNIILDPFDKLIDSDQLTYLPNLYLRSHKAI